MCSLPQLLKGVYLFPSKNLLRNKESQEYLFPRKKVLGIIYFLGNKYWGVLIEGNEKKRKYIIRKNVITRIVGDLESVRNKN